MCSSPKPAVTGPPKPQPKNATTATISPAVRALLKPDPDLDAKLTKEQIKATLEAAQQKTQLPPPSSDVPVTDSGAWSKLESDQKAKLDAYRQRLAQTIVFIGPDGRYHTRSCPTLLEKMYDPQTGLVVDYRFIGRQTTLANAADQHLAPHAECGAPSYDFSYGQ